ncbi:MAG TPA: hypothetical protein VFZ91_00010 [Allosphingosinicella sp.]
MPSGKVVSLIIAADEPALFFSSPEIAETYLEAADVRSGTYPEAYGPGGEPFDITADRFDQVAIHRNEGSPARPERVRAIVEGFLDACGISHSADMPLAALLALCAPYVDDGT